LGFYAKYSHRIVECESCLIQDETSGKVRSILKDFIRENKVSVYNEATGTGLLRHLMTRTGFKTGEVMVVLVINGKDIPHKQKLIDTLVAEVPQIKSIMLNINQKNTNIILGERNIKLFGKDHITDYIGKYKFFISPLSFFSVNPFRRKSCTIKPLNMRGFRVRKLSLTSTAA
jgi:23S rRNA (uracil1939-C5)-methyltransferase